MSREIFWMVGPRALFYSCLLRRCFGSLAGQPGFGTNQFFIFAFAGPNAHWVIFRSSSCTAVILVTGAALPAQRASC